MGTHLPITFAGAPFRVGMGVLPSARMVQFKELSRPAPAIGEGSMARYGKASQESVHRAMHKLEHGTLRSGGSGAKVKSRQQAIAIGLSEARAKGAKVPAAKPRSKSASKKP